MPIIVKDEDGIIKEINLFGTNLAKIECFKPAGLFSFAVMGVSCVGYLFWTGKTQKLIEVALVSYWGTFWPYWFHCRWKLQQQKFEVVRSLKMHREITEKRGTAQDLRQYITDTEAGVR